jgi:hypothetical protein
VPLLGAASWLQFPDVEAQKVQRTKEKNIHHVNPQVTCQAKFHY